MCYHLHSLYFWILIAWSNRGDLAVIWVDRSPRKQQTSSQTFGVPHEFRTENWEPQRACLNCCKVSKNCVPRLRNCHVFCHVLSEILRKNTKFHGFLNLMVCFTSVSQGFQCHQALTLHLLPSCLEYGPPMQGEVQSAWLCPTLSWPRNEKHNILDLTFQSLSSCVRIIYIYVYV